MNQAERYEQEIIRVMERHLGCDSVCVDIGAHEGAVLREMERLAPKAKHLAFEPLPYLAENLEKNFPRSRIFSCALGDGSGMSEYYHVRNDPAYSGLRRRSYDRQDPQIERIHVPLARLDDVLDPSIRISFIKLDIEGGEYHAMMGGTATIRRCRPVIVFEASDRSTGHYGVTASMVYGLVHDAFGFDLSTMERWLEGAASLSRKEFGAVYGDEYYFIAYP